MHGKGQDREQHCRALAKQASGLRYDSPDAIAILDQEDWSQIWPVVDGDGILTGEIVGSEEGYVNVEDLAMVAVADLSTEQRESIADGYVVL